MTNDVRNRVPVGTPKMEKVELGFISRCCYEPSAVEGFVNCIEKCWSTKRKPKENVIHEWVENNGDIFIPSDYGYED